MTDRETIEWRWVMFDPEPVYAVRVTWDTPAGRLTMLHWVPAEEANNEAAKVRAVGICRRLLEEGPKGDGMEMA